MATPPVPLSTGTPAIPTPPAPAPAPAAFTAGAAAAGAGGEAGSTSSTPAPPPSTLSAPRKEHEYGRELPQLPGMRANAQDDMEPIDDALARDFPTIAKMSQEDMRELVDDDSLFDAYFNTSDYALPAHQAKERRLQALISLAQGNIKMRDQLETLRDDTARSFAAAQELRGHWAHLSEAQMQAYKRMSPAAQLGRLRAATTAQEHVAESLSTSFVDGDMDDDEFVRQYKDVRKVFHRRMLMKSKWEDGKLVWNV